MAISIYQGVSKTTPGSMGSVVHLSAHLRGCTAGRHNVWSEQAVT